MVLRVSVRFWPALILGLLAPAFLYRLAFTDLILARGDTYTYFYPYWDARSAALSEGDLPLWTPDLFMGAPLMANSQLGVLYPPNWLMTSLNAPHAVRMSILLHLVWAALGMYLLARRAAHLEPAAALAAAGVFAFGGHLGAHVEQINQFQGLSWMPWLFLAFHQALARPLGGIPLLAGGWALQILSGHAQTAFITGVGLELYALAHALSDKTDRRWPTRLLRPAAILAGAAAIAVILALPQLIPSQELAALSNRGGGLNQQQATAFSWTPALAGRGLLPSYDAQPFGEYVAYVGMIGLGLALLGAFWPHAGHGRWVWVGLAAAGLFLALGRYNPFYLPLAALPGFNLFRVPARWLALFALGASMLAGFGVQTVLHPDARGFRRIHAFVIFGLLAALMASALVADRAAAEVNGPARPTSVTWLAWGAALAGLAGIYAVFLKPGPRDPPVSPRSRSIYAALSRLPSNAQLYGIAALVLLLGELWFASQALPYNDASDPSAYDEPRFAVSLMRVLGEGQTPPGRLLSISGLLFDPGDRAALEARWARLGLGHRAAAYAFTAVKLRETLAANLPLTWGVPSIDGFDGGLLPTIHYTAFTSLLLPEGALRTVDGRLRELLALPECRGACIPDGRWLDLTGTRYLLTDKVYDMVYDGIFFDAQWPVTLAAGEIYTFEDTQAFQATAAHVLFTPLDQFCPQPCLPTAEFVTADGQSLALDPPTGDLPVMDGLLLARFEAAQAVTPQAVTFQADGTVLVRAVSLVDGRTGDFVQLTPNGWRRVYSADVKIYENLDVLPRAFVVHEAEVFPDTWDGSEQALARMRQPDFDPARTVAINADHGEPLSLAPSAVSTADIVEYTPTRVVIEVDAAAPGYLVLTDAFYPGWRASVNSGDSDAEIYRADVMFRAVRVQVGRQTITFEYDPGWLPLARYAPLIWGLLAVLWGGAVAAGRRLSEHRHFA